MSIYIIPLIQSGLVGLCMICVYYSYQIAKKIIDEPKPDIKKGALALVFMGFVIILLILLIIAKTNYSG